MPRPETRHRPRVADPRIRRLGAIWMELVLAAISVLGALIIWHLARRGRLIRDRLAPPKDVRLPEFEPRSGPPRVPEPENGPSDP